MWCPSDTESNDARPEKFRSCTDIFWLCIFISFWIIMVLIAVFSFVYGNPLRLINGYDSFGNTCGDKNDRNVNSFELSGMDMSTKRFSFYMDFTNLEQSLQICVEKCPDKDLRSVSELKEYYEKTGIFLCRYDVNLSEIQYPEYFSPMPNDASSVNITESAGLSQGPCPVFPVYKSSPVLNRCIPDAIQGMSSSFISNMYGMLNSWDSLEEMISDVYESWNWILILSFISICLSLVIISLMYAMASIISWTIVVGISSASVVITGILWWTYISIRCQLNEMPEERLLEESVKNEETFLWFAIISSIVTIIVLLIAYTVRKRIPFLTTLFQEASTCLIKLPTLFILPVITVALLIIFYTFWVIVILYLATARYPTSRTVRTTGFKLDTSLHMMGINNSAVVPLNVSVAEVKNFTVMEYVDNTWIKYMWIVYLIGLIWITEFLLACQQMVVAGSVARWYFYRDRKEMKSPVLVSIGHLCGYHLGSAALGSILITIFKVPRLILTYLYTRYKGKQGIKCCLCGFYCWEKFIRYMNHNAYTVVIIQGIGFSPAAVRAWNILSKNTLKLTTINTVGDLILFFGKCFVAAVVGCLAVTIFKYDSNLHFYAVPTFIVIVFSFFIAHCILSLYEFVIDTLFLCICEDQEMNGDNGYWRQSSLCAVNSKHKTTEVSASSVLPTEL